jgi:hypothetical protein
MFLQMPASGLRDCLAGTSPETFQRSLDAFERIRGLIATQLPPTRICIPRNVEILGKSCFSASRLESIIFENESRLTFIGKTSFNNCPNLDCVDCLAGTGPGTIQRSLDAFERIRGLIATQLPPTRICIRFDVDRCDTSMPMELKSMGRDRLRFHTSADVLTVPDWIAAIRPNDFRRCSALRAVVVGMDSSVREIFGFRDCPLLESIEVRAPDMLIGSNAFRSSVLVRTRKGYEKKTVRQPIFVIVANEDLLKKTRKRCQTCICCKKRRQQIFSWNDQSSS